MYKHGANIKLKIHGLEHGTIGIYKHGANIKLKIHGLSMAQSEYINMEPT